MAPINTLPSASSLLRRTEHGLSFITDHYVRRLRIASFIYFNKNPVFSRQRSCIFCRDFIYAYFEVSIPLFINICYHSFHSICISM
jgi:hypothetical protein